MNQKQAIKIFTDELDSTLSGYEAEHQLGGAVFSEKTTDSEFLVNRQNELKQLGRSVASCINGLCKKIVIHGERGIGKTTIADILSKSKTEKPYRPIRLNALTYSFNHSRFKKGIFDQMLFSKINDINDSDRTESNQDFKQVILELTAKNTLDEVMQTAAEKNLCSPPEKDRDKSELFFFKEFIEKTTDKPKIMILDDYQALIKNEENAKFVRDLIEQKIQKLSFILIMPTSEFTQLKNTDLDLLKDVKEIRVGPLNADHLCELLRIRIANYRSEPDPIKEDSAYLPFTKNALYQIAALSGGNPLEFIKISREFYEILRTKKEKLITTEFVNKFAPEIHQEQSKNTNYSLTEKQGKIYSILLENLNGLTSEKIADTLYKKYGSNKTNIQNNTKKPDTKANIIQILRPMIANHTVTKEKRNRFVFYKAQRPPTL